MANDSRSGYSLVLTAGPLRLRRDGPRRSPRTGSSSRTSTARRRSPAATRCYGCWTAQALVVHRGYATAGGFNTQATVHDFAFAVVGPGGKSNSQLDATVGSFPIAFSGVSAGNTLYAFGYPAAGKYHGNDLTYCAGPIFTDSSNSNLTWGMACGMTGGSSGGPWLSSFNTGTGVGTLSSLNSYGYSGVRNMYGPKFNANTQAVYNAANSATSNTIVN